jgi:hypothetical protein
MTPQVLLNCMLFRGVGYVTRQVGSAGEKLFVVLFRGIAGASLIFFMGNWANPNIHWNIWAGIGMFLVGMAWVNILLWAAVLLVPLNLMGVLQPLWKSFTDFIVAFFLIIGLIIWAVASGFQNNRASR